MKDKKNLVFNVLLSTAVVVLYYLHFTTTASSEVQNLDAESGSVQSLPNNHPKLYFVNTDTLSENYQFAKELDSTLRNKTTQSERKFRSEVEKFENQVREFQEKARFMTQEEGEKRQEELVIKERELAKLESDLSEKLLNDQEILNKELRKKILAYIKRTADQRNITFVFGYSAIENNILLADDSLDLTQEILEGLNKEYRAEKMK